MERLLSVVETCRQGGRSVAAYLTACFLAKQTGQLIAVAQKLYDAEYDKLRDDAKVTDFVAVLALRHTRERLLALQKNRRASAANATYELFSA